MPVGTLGTVKGLTPAQIKATGAKKILSNTYHLALRPGAEVVEELGGLHTFIHWDGPILTDSGGFQVFSLAKQRKMDDHQVVFRSHIDGSIFELSPEKCMRIQEQLGADCIMCLDECPPADAPIEKIEAAVNRTTRWAKRCRDSHQRSDQALFGIVQGAIDSSMREKSATELLPLDFPGYAVGGLSVGEDPVDMYSTLDFTTPFLPANKPRYLMGVGRPIDIVESIVRGIDLFDCVMPTRNGRNAMTFTSQGKVKLRNKCHEKDQSALDPACGCLACTNYSRGYLRHLFMSKEMLGPILASIHNLTFYQKTIRDLRDAILENRSAEFVERFRTTQ
ncbi:UNVERIFIED_CONTAM: hypothetical protein GTU68_049193 [Idotea baltica]|nr:hypothetical protein [Idotea baltica]